jgi:hypothetical protein
LWRVTDFPVRATEPASAPSPARMRMVVVLPARCGRRARCDRQAAPAAWRRRWTAACAPRRGPRGPLR